MPPRQVSHFDNFDAYYDAVCTHPLRERDAHEAMPFFILIVVAR
jgi:hypothetical protein